MEKWYEIKKNSEYVETILEMFCDLHDYRITNINYDLAKNTIDVHFEYDTHDEGVIFKFINVKKLNINTDKDYEFNWLTGAQLYLNEDDNLVWWDNDDYNYEKILNNPYITWIEAEYLHFTFVNKDGKIIELPEDRINPVFSTLNFETYKYESKQKHFEVYEV